MTITLTIDQVVLDEVYKSKKEKSADTLSAESEETQVIFWGQTFWNIFWWKT